eukprot:7380102-Prymnesium_polylepis.1
MYGTPSAGTCTQYVRYTCSQVYRHAQRPLSPRNVLPACAGGVKSDTNGDAPLLFVGAAFTRAYRDPDTSHPTPHAVTPTAQAPGWANSTSSVPGCKKLCSRSHCVRTAFVRVIACHVPVGPCRP